MRVRKFRNQIPDVLFRRRGDLRVRVDAGLHLLVAVADQRLQQLKLRLLSLALGREPLQVVNGLLEVGLRLVRMSERQMAAADPFQQLVLHLGRVAVLEREAGVSKRQNVVLPFI